MKIANLLRKLIISLYTSLKRFPAAIGLSTAAAVLLMILGHNEQSFSAETKELIGRVVMTLALGIPVSLCTKLVFERWEAAKAVYKIGICLLEALGLVLYLFFFLKGFEMVPVTRYIGLSLFFYLAFLFIPYLYKREGFELYVIRHMTRFFTAVIYSVVLFLGTAAILFTIDKLLEIRVDELIYLDVWLGVVGIFAPSFFLAGVPLYNEQLTASSYPKLLKVLLLYIVMPIITAYTAILYAYFAKIIVTLQWPIGMVAHLVLWYSVLCSLVIFLVSPTAGENKWARTFIYWLPKIILPLILMMFVSISIRIRAYGITENRYFVIVLGLWAFGMMLYWNFNKNRHNILLPLSLSIIALLSVVGPWSSYSVSMFSQNQRLEGILQKYAMIRDNSIVKPQQEVAAIDKKEISEILSYFSESHALSDVRYLPKGFELSQTEMVFGFPNTGNNYYNNARVHFIYSSNNSVKPLNIKGYSYMFRSNDLGSSIKGNGIEAGYDGRTFEVAIASEGKELYRNSLLELVRQLHGRYGEQDRYGIDPEELSLADENGNVKVKYIFKHIDSYRDSSSGEIKLELLDFYVLVELK